MIVLIVLAAFALGVLAGSWLEFKLENDP